MFPKLNNSYRSKGYYEIPLTDKRLHDDCNADDDIKCYVSQMKGSVKYIKKDSIKGNKLGSWQIITPSAAHGAFSGFGNLIIGTPTDVYSETYISFALTTETEAKSLLSYMNCRLPNMLLSLRKISQNISNDTCKWIPLPPLNKDWTDEDVYNHFKLSEDDIQLINETNVVGYKSNVKPTEGSIEISQPKPKRVFKKNKKADEPIVVDVALENATGTIIKPKRVLKVKSKIVPVVEPTVQPPKL
jgi:hypothetical protein